MLSFSRSFSRSRQTRLRGHVVPLLLCRSADLGRVVMWPRYCFVTPAVPSNQVLTSQMQTSMIRPWISSVFPNFHRGTKQTRNCLRLPFETGREACHSSSPPLQPETRPKKQGMSSFNCLKLNLIRTSKIKDERRRKEKKKGAATADGRWQTSAVRRTMHGSKEGGRGEGEKNRGILSSRHYRGLHT